MSPYLNTTSITGVDIRDDYAMIFASSTKDITCTLTGFDETKQVTFIMNSSKQSNLQITAETDMHCINQGSLTDGV